MYKNIYNFMPFQHENLEFKNNFIAFARGQDQTKPEGALAAVLIYANLVDYIARQLLKDLLAMVSIQGFRAFGGVMFFDGSKKRTSVALGGLIAELEFFEFPNKVDFLDSLRTFNKVRRDTMHNLMQLDPADETRKVDKDLAKIRELAEEILNKYNTIGTGLGGVWNTVNGNQSTDEPSIAPNPFDSENVSEEA